MYHRPTRESPAGPPDGSQSHRDSTSRERSPSASSAPSALTGVAFHALREIAHHNSRKQESLLSHQSPEGKPGHNLAASVETPTPAQRVATESLSSPAMTDRAGSADVEMKGETTPASAAPSIIPSEKDTPFIVNKTDEPSTNGTHQTEEDDDLSPPPDIMESPPADERPQDEIVVNANRKGADKSSPFQVTSDQEDDGTTQDLDDEDDEPRPMAPYPKRKRHSVASDLNDDDVIPAASPDIDGRGVNHKYRMVSARRTAAGFKHAILGFWRDSPVPDDEQKHAVVGFIDIRDRLRTRIQITTRTYDKIDLAKYPVPPGPGGSWVTFERVVFEPHLVGLNHHHVKEFVKQRAGIDNETPEEKMRNDLEAVAVARRRMIDNPPPDTAPQPVVAYGDVIPDDAIICSRSEIAKRRKLGSGVGTINGGPLAHHQRTQPTPPRMGPRSMGPPGTQEIEFSNKADPVPVFDALFGTRPTRVVIGFWKPSDAPNEIDRHAVLGILGQNDMFRAKVVRETRDGRFYDGNFPNGAGALWIQWNEIVLEPQLRGLNRSEVKEYVRVRQWQLDRYIEKTREDRHANETSAVYVAQQRVAHGVKVPPGNGAAVPQDEEMEEAEFPDPANEVKPSASAQDLRSSFTRADGRTELPQARHALPSNDRAPSRTPIAARRDFDTYATREIERLGHQEARRAHFAAAHDALNLMHAQHGNSHGNSPVNHQGPAGLPGQMPGPGHAPSPLGHQHPVGPGHAPINGPQNPAFNDRITQLDHIWKMQEEHRSNRPSSDDTKFFGGVKYERKANGFWSGKLVSSGTIITIDGEDYVEYRVLTKPQFF